MRTRYGCVSLAFLVVSAAFGQTVPPKQNNNEGGVETARSGSLPVKKVVLYKNGVGYFEHTGQVRGNQELGIQFTTAQLNDVLKSLTLVDLNGGRISAVRYNSVAPLSEQLKSLQIPLGEEVSSATFLTALRGTRVEVKSGATGAMGKVFSVETVEKETAKGGTVNATQLAIVTDTGELRLFEIGPGVSVRAAEREIHKDVDRYLNLMGSTRSKDVRRVTITASGPGERNVFVSYISEVPVWKSTYRIVLPKAPGKPFLQGWAIVDNTVGEDWKDVRLTLVSGTPQSFIQNISQPYYTRRPVVPLPESVMLTPQAHEATMEEGGKLMSPRAIVGGVAGRVPGGVAGGSMGGVIGGVIGAPPPKPTGAEEEPIENEVVETLSSEVAEAESKLVGDLFEYDLKEKITLLKNQSALVPIVQSPIEAEKVTLVTATGSADIEESPRRALWLRNTSGETLDGGTFNILEQDSFAGEGIMDMVHPGERRLLSYAADKAVHVARGDEGGARTTTRVTIVKGMMTIYREQRDVTTYTIRNADSAPRQVIVEHPIRSGWKLTGSAKPEESGATHYRFRVAVQPGKTEKLTIEEGRPEASRINVSGLSDAQVTTYAQEGTVRAPLDASLRKIIAKRSEVSDIEQQIKAKQLEREAIDRDQARLRENMKALRGSAEEKALLQRYTKQLDTQEDQLATLQKQTEDLKAKRAALQVGLDAMVMEIQIDERM